MSKTVTKKGFVAFCNYLLPAVKDGHIGDKEWARAAMLAFGDLGSIPSGLVSKKLLWTHAPTGRVYRKSKVTHEHFKTRTKTCREIVGVYLRDELTQEALNAIIEEGRKVHLVEEYENIVLRPYQQDESIEDWQTEYTNAGIELVKDPGIFGHKLYFYEIETIMYADKHEAAKKHKCSTATVVNRSRSEKWPKWKQFKYDFKE